MCSRNGGKTIQRKIAKTTFLEAIAVSAECGKDFHKIKEFSYFDILDDFSGFWSALANIRMLMRYPKFSIYLKME